MTHHQPIQQEPTETKTNLLPEIVPAKPWIISRLRSMTPSRPLTFREAQVIAEHQASALLTAWGLANADELRVPEEVISELPRIDVRYGSGLAQSGHSTWEAGAWRVTINADEWHCRRRFTLAHELKHILDSPHESAIYADLPSRTPAEQRARTRHIEALCDHFAACLLMPRASVKRAWGNGMQSIAELARAFDVSHVAMNIRLQNIGLIPRPHRSSSTIGRLAIQASGTPQGSTRHYHRQPAAAASFRPRDLVLHAAHPSATMDPDLALATTGDHVWQRP